MATVCYYYMGERRGTYRLPTEKYDGKRPSGRPRHRREDNNKSDPQDTLCESVDWIYLFQDRDRWRTSANMVTKLYLQSR
jgi:hypothetical protein